MNKLPRALGLPGIIITTTINLKFSVLMVCDSMVFGAWAHINKRDTDSLLTDMLKSFTAKSTLVEDLFYTKQYLRLALPRKGIPPHSPTPPHCFRDKEMETKRV